MHESFVVLTDFVIDDIDHIEMFVSDRLKAAKWYENVFGLHIIHDLDMWSKTGPLFIGNKDRTVMLALINGTRENNGSINRMAFRISGKRFVDFVSHVDDLNLFFIKEQVTKNNVVDHYISFSIYFDDPDGNKLELTSYDYDSVKSNI
jgi:catechol 2,3-dioxygenase-like lactoylglutathione lyase family enzyme